MLNVRCSLLSSIFSHHILSPAGPHAARTASLWHLYTTICIVVFLAVVGATLYATYRHSRPRKLTDDTAPEITPHPATERRLTLTVSAAVLVSTILLFVMLLADFSTGRANHQFSESPNPITIRLTAHQWWWEFTYTDADPQNVFTTANELHVPVGRPVKLDLNSADVIHSVWIPNLTGKKDAIPGHPTSLYFQADKPGTYLAPCAEFCGHQHAQMRFLVIAEPQDKFDAWLAASRSPAREPQSDSEKLGRQLFVSGTCSTCHTIAGTPAKGRLGPDLTHLASRQTLAATTLPNTKGHLGGWILDPQHLKPGSRMPKHNLTGPQLQSLLDYLTSLK